MVPEHLGVLNLSFNRLTTLPKALGKAPVLQQMYLANNQLSDLPDSFAALPMVDLFLSGECHLNFRFCLSASCQTCLTALPRCPWSSCSCQVKCDGSMR